jgi:aquaporin Z
VSLAFGLSLLAMAYAIGPISGCHVNPAVTVGLLLSKKMDAKYAVGYFIFQVIGAIVAAGVLYSSPRGCRLAMTLPLAGLQRMAIVSTPPRATVWAPPFSWRSC